MPSNVSVSLAEWDDWRKQLEQFLIDDQQQIVAHVTEVAAVKFDQIVRDVVPPVPRRRKASLLWTKKQNAWWWATMHAKALGQSRALPGWRAKYVQKNGRTVLQISGAYKRSGTGIKSLTYRVRSGNNGKRPFAVAQYGSNRDYMRYVMDADDQALYHEGNWPKLQVLLQASADTLAKVAMEALNREVDRRLKT